MVPRSLVMLAAVWTNNASMSSSCCSVTSLIVAPLARRLAQAGPCLRDPFVHAPAAQTALPPAALAYSRLGEIPLEQARAGAGSATWCGRSPGRSRAHHPCRGAAAVEAVRQLVRRYLHPEGALAHLSLAEVAEQRQQRPDLAARELEFGAVGVRAPLRGREFSDFLQVDAPVPPAHHVDGEPLPGQHLLRLSGLQIRAQRHVGGEKPRRGTETDQVVVTLPRRLRDADLPGRTSHLRRQHREQVKDRMPEGEPAELPRVVGIGELESRQGDVAPPLAQHARHRLSHPNALLGVGVEDEKNRGLTWRVHPAPPSIARNCSGRSRSAFCRMSNGARDLGHSSAAWLCPESVATDQQGRAADRPSVTYSRASMAWASRSRST